MATLLKELTIENGRGETILWGRGIAVKITRTYKRLKEYRIGATVPVKQRVWLGPVGFGMRTRKLYRAVRVPFKYVEA